MSDIAELFARDPLELAQQDLEKIVTKFREDRKNFNLAGGGTKTTAKETKASKTVGELDLGDL